MQIGRYRHYKGKFYRVLSVALHTETREKMVAYKALYDCPELADEYGTDPLFVRPYAMFCESVEIDGHDVPRFEYVGD
jgi:hypothetical protein